MKKLTFAVAICMLFHFSFANGLLTNTNQSTQFVRMMSRNASLGIDGVYYNPAGLIKLEDGWHFSLNNQSVFQTIAIDTEFPWLNDGHYEGITNAYFFPSGFAVYKNNKLAVSFGFGSNAGGVSASYDRGLPSFEIPLSKYMAGMNSLTPLFLQSGFPAVSGYKANLSFEGSSVIWGFQLGATYKINEIFSVYLGARYVPGKNTYYGEINDFSVNNGEGSMPASDYMKLISPVLDQTVTVLGVVSNSLQAAIAAGQLDPNSTITNTQVIEIMTFLGKPKATNQEAVNAMTSTKGILVALKSTDVSNKTVDVGQTGSFFTGIAGVNISPNEFFNIGLRYENKTFLTVKNNTAKDDLNLFPNGKISRNDIPGIIGVGIGYTDNKWIEAQLSFNMYLDKYVSWGANVRDISVWQGIDNSKIRISEIEQNSFDIALGMQFNVSKVFSLSAGGMYQKSGVADNFNSDFRFAPPSYVGVGCGFLWKATDQIVLDLGVSGLFYQDAKVVYDDPQLGNSYNETYGKEAFSFAVGLSYRIPY